MAGGGAGIRHATWRTLPVAVMLALVASCTSSPPPDESSSGVARTAISTTQPGAELVADPADAGDKDSGEQPVHPEGFEPPEPTSSELIAAALQSGVIDEETAVIYRVWALFDPGLLPGQYLGAQEPHDLGLLTSIALGFDELSTHTQETLLPYLVRPTDPRSHFNAATDAEGLRAPQKAFAADHARIAPPGAPQWESRTVGDHFRVWVRTDVPMPLPAEEALKRTADIIEKYADRMAADMGIVYLEDTGSADFSMLDKLLLGSDNDSRIDIYVVPGHMNTPGRPGGGDVGEYAWTMGTGFANDTRASSFVAMGSDHIAEQGLYERMVVHELFHVIQNTQNATVQNQWIQDSTAEWAAWHYVTEERGALTESRMPIAQNWQDTSLGRASVDGRSPYGDYLWWVFAEQEFGSAETMKMVGDMWRGLAHESRGVGTQRVLDVMGEFMDVEGILPEYAMRVLNVDLPGNPLGTQFADYDASFPKNMMPTHAENTLGRDPVTSGWFDGMPELTFKYMVLKASNLAGEADGAPISISISSTLRTPGGNTIALEALVRAKDGAYRRVPVDHFSGQGRLCTYGDVFLVATNNNRGPSETVRGSITFERVPGADCATIEVTNPASDRRMKAGEAVPANDVEGDGKPGSAPLVITVSAVAAENVDALTVTATASGGTLTSPREFSWPLAEFDKVGPDTWRMANTIALEVDLTDANRPWTIATQLKRGVTDVDQHTVSAKLFGEQACIYGNWVVDNAAFAAIVQDTAIGSGGMAGANLTISGLAEISFFEDHTYDVRYQDWMITVRMEQAGEQVTIILSRNGDASGTFTFEGNVLVQVEGQDNSNPKVTMNGMVIPGDVPGLGDNNDSAVTVNCADAPERIVITDVEGGHLMLLGGALAEEARNAEK